VIVARTQTSRAGENTGQNDPDETKRPCRVSQTFPPGVPIRVPNKGPAYGKNLFPKQPFVNQWKYEARAIAQPFTPGFPRKTRARIPRIS
jgi:hypothetical protein